MCGIAGYSRRDTDDDKIIVRMLSAIGHRGPDDSGYYADRDMALGNALLAIVNIGNGHQPMIYEWAGETYVGVFNGEIYNYKEIRTTLQSKGQVFKTDCDTEVAIAAFALWGTAAFPYFEGQWALAIWAVRAQTLFLCRDPLGIKPLFYHHENNLFAFASEPKALFTHPAISKAPNVTAIKEYFLHGFAFAAGYSLNHRSFFDGVDSLEPGSWLSWRKGSTPRIEKYFELVASPNQATLKFDDAVDSLRTAVSSSVIASMMGDAPIGVALSGGLDSSIITAIAAKEMARRGAPPLLSTCITYREQTVNEDARHAAILADYLKDTAPLRLTYSYMGVDSYLSDMDLMIRHFDEPHWEVKQLAMFNNYRALKQNGAKVVLTGEGADELFFGYFHKFPGFKNPVIKSSAELESLWATRLPVVQQLFRGESRHELSGLMTEAINRFYRPYSDQGATPEKCMQYWYLSTFLHWLLIDNDRCSMAFSLEGRFPFLNRRVFDVAFRISSALQVGHVHGQEKLVLREAFRNILPESIWRDRKKAPLPSPLKLAFHQKIFSSLRVSMEEVPASFWDVIDRQHISTLLRKYEQEIGTSDAEQGGERLTSYLSLSEPWSLRTPHIFGILTLLRWWKINFS